jgi:hypothetical protein
VALDVVDEPVGDLVEEAAGRVVLRTTEQRPAPGVGQVEALPGPGDPDVGEPPLLLELVGLGERAQVGEDPVLQPDDEHDGELEALGGVQGHEHHRGLVGLVEVVDVGHQADRLEELVDRLDLAGGPDQLGQVLEPALGFDGALGLEGVEVAGALEQRL